MKITCYLIAFMLASATSYGQNFHLTGYLRYPRLDSAYWQGDYERLNPHRSKGVNRCQTCVFTQADTTRGRFCFNTSLGHVQLDTSLYNFSAERLIGKWNVIDFGLFEIADSMRADAKAYYRDTVILNEQQSNLGYISFTEKRYKTHLQNIEGIPNKNKRYKISDGRFLTARLLSGFCGATFIGLTKDDLLILDDHTFRTLAVKGKYLVVRTSIRRIILKKDAAG